MRSSKPIAAAGTHPGRERENNEDRVLSDPERGIFAVVDGVGGESGGEIAAQTAHDVLRARLSRRTTDLERLVREAIALANRQIYERAQAEPRLAGMSCVLTVALLDGDHATVGHVGDSRLYLLRRGEIRKITRDHSPVGAREDAGEISEEDAMGHPRRNEIFRDVGSAPHEPDDPGFIEVYRVPFEHDGALLVCSDGLTDLVPSARIREAVETHAGDPQKAVQRLIEEANEAGGKDNISVVLVEGDRYAEELRTASRGATETRPLAQQAPKQFGAAHVREPLWRRVLAWVPLLLLLGAAGVVLLYPPVRDRALALIDKKKEETSAPPPPAPVIRVGAGEADFLSISDALAEARPGQTIEIAPGEYRELIELKEGIALVSLVPRGAVIRAPQGAAAGVAAVTGREVSARLSGLRILGDREAPLTVGLRLDGARVDASEIEILGTSEAGIEIAGADRSTLSTSYVHDNAGAGIVVSGRAATQLRQNLIARNGLRTPKRPGVEIRELGRPLLVENRIETNGAAGVWLPSLDRADEILQWNQFGRTPRSQRVRISPPAAPVPPAERRQGQ